MAGSPAADLGRRAAAKGECHIEFDDLAAHASGLLAGILGTSGQRPRMCQRYRDLFGDRCYLVAELHRGPEDRRLLESFIISASGPGAADRRQRRALSRQETPAAARRAHRHPSWLHGGRAGQAHFSQRRTLSQIRRPKWPSCSPTAPRRSTRTAEVAERCTFSLDELRYEYPEELCPAGTTPFQHLTELTWHGAGERYPDGIPDKVRGLIEHELKLIEELHYEAYFLTVWDLVRFARGRDILCQGRGSAANSAVCFCLGITSVDPDRIDVLFERFVSKERDEAPDIDVDFEHERREEVLQYSTTNMAGSGPA